MEFKVGDKIEIIENSHGGFKVGTIAYVTKTDIYRKDITTEERVFYKVSDNDKEFTHVESDLKLYEEVFPEKWCIKITEENKHILEEERLTRAKSNYTSCLDNTGWLISDLNWDKTCISYTVNLTKLGEYTEITLDQFKKHILKEKETMENLLETEFVIENCTLSQRLAIKAYCDEKKIKVYENSFEENATKEYPHLAFNGKYFVGSYSIKNRKLIIFSELIQFLDQYQLEPEFKVGDFVYFDGKFHKAGPYLLKEKISDGEFKDSNNETRDIKESKGAYRYARPEEIKKWKEENEIKLPKIDGNEGLLSGGTLCNTHLKWGCTEISISTVKELLKLNLTHINFDDGREADYKQIQQIKKFIEHNKL
jgi:hypothetical protein